MNRASPILVKRGALRELIGELLGSALLVMIVFASGAARVQFGGGTIGGALVGSIALGLGYGLVVWSLGSLSGAQTNPLVSILATVLGGQSWRSTLRRLTAQVIGASVSALAIARLLPYTLVPEPADVSVRPFAEAVAAFGFVLVALGVARRRDVHVPIALGAYALSSFWMTGHSTVGNPLLSAAVFVVAMGEHAGMIDLVRLVGATAVGATVAALIGAFLFPRARDAASLLLFSPTR